MAKSRMTPQEIEEYAQECAQARMNVLQDHLKRVKAKVEASALDWNSAIFHAVPADLRRYSEGSITHMHLDYIEMYLAQPVCASCNRLHTNRTCPHCGKSLCIYCEHGTYDHRVNVCRECKSAVMRQQESEVQPCV